MKKVNQNRRIYILCKFHPTIQTSNSKASNHHFWDSLFGLDVCFFTLLSIFYFMCMQCSASFFIRFCYRCVAVFVFILTNIVNNIILFLLLLFRVRNCIFSYLLQIGLVYLQYTKLYTPGPVLHHHGKQQREMPSLSKFFRIPM